MAEVPRSTDDGPVGRLLVAAALVAILTLGLVVRFGLQEPPPLDPVDLATRPDRAVALLTWRDAERSQCLDVITPDGGVREVRCGLDGTGPLLAWDERGIVLVRYLPGGERLEAIDAVTGARTTIEEAVPGELTMRWTGTWVDAERDGATLTLRDEQERVLWRVEAPDAYRVPSAALDLATGTHVLLDSAGRLLVLPPGADEPRVWVEDVGAEYGELLWEGTPLPAD